MATGFINGQDATKPVVAPTTMDKVNGFVGSPTGAAAINAIGSAASAYGQAQQQNADRQLTAKQQAANELARQSDQDRLNARSALTPLGESQNYVAHNSILNAILPNMRNFNSPQSGNQQARGGFLPDGGLGQANVENLYGNAPTLEALSQRAKQLAAVNPDAPQENFANYGSITGQQAQPFMGMVDKYQGQQADRAGGQRDQINSLIQQGIEKENQDEDPSNGFWHKFAKWAAVAGAGAATVFTAGAATPLLLAAAGAAGAWGAGGGAKGALLGAGTGYAGGMIGQSNMSPITKAVIGTGINQAGNAAMR